MNDRINTALGLAPDAPLWRVETALRKLVREAEEIRAARAEAEAELGELRAESAELFIQAIRGCNQYGHAKGCPDANGGGGASPKDDTQNAGPKDAIKKTLFGGWQDKDGYYVSTKDGRYYKPSGKPSKSPNATPSNVAFLANKKATVQQVSGFDAPAPVTYPRAASDNTLPDVADELEFAIEPNGGKERLGVKYYGEYYVFDDPQLVNEAISRGLVKRGR